MTDHADDPAEGLLTAEADDVFVALADRTRRRILVRLAEQPDDAGAVALDLGVSRQAAAKQLRQLVDAGLVEVRTDRRRRVHSVETERLREISDLLGMASRGWERRLSQVKDLAEQRSREKSGE